MTERKKPDERARRRARLTDARYRRAVEHIAWHDDPSELDPRQVRGYLSVGLVADVWNQSTLVVARDVITTRRGYVIR